MEKVENFILLEFLVEELNLDSSQYKGDTIVSFQFLDHVPLVITQKLGFEGFCEKGPDDSVKFGKACLFSLQPWQIDDAKREFNLNIEIYTQNKQGDKFPIGKSVAPLNLTFKQLMETVSKQRGKTTSMFYPLKNTDDKQVGKIKVYVRLSCFGKLMITQLQMNMDNKTVEFQTKEGHYLFKYEKTDARCVPTTADVEKSGCH